MVSSLNAKREQPAPDADGVANDVKPRLASPASRAQQEGPWRQGELAASFDAPNDRDALLYGVLRLLERVVPRRAILVVGRDQLRAFDGEGFSLAPGQAASFSLAVHQGSLLARAVQGDGPVAGSPAELGLTPWYSFTGQAQPSGICLAPIAIQGRTALLILADPGAQPLDHGIVPWIAILARRTSAAIATLIASQKRTRADAPTGILPVVRTTPPQNDPAPPTADEHPLPQADAADAAVDQPVDHLADSPAPNAEPSVSGAEPATSTPPDSAEAPTSSTGTDTGEAPTSSTGTDTGEAPTDALPEGPSAEPVGPERLSDSDELEDESQESVWSAHDHPTVEVQVCQTGAYSEVDSASDSVWDAPAEREGTDVPADVVEVAAPVEPEEVAAPVVPVEAEVPADPLEFGAPAAVTEAALPAESAEIVPSDFEHTQITRVEQRPPDFAGESPDVVDREAQSNLQGATPEPASRQTEPGEMVDDSVLRGAAPARTRNLLTEFPLVVDESPQSSGSESTGEVDAPVLLNPKMTLVPLARQQAIERPARRTITGEDPFSESGLAALEQSDLGAPISGFPDLNVPPPTSQSGSTESQLHFAGPPSDDASAQVWTASQIGLESLSAAPELSPAAAPDSTLAADPSAVQSPADALDVQPQVTAQARRRRAFADTMDTYEPSSSSPRTASVSPLYSGQTEPLIDPETQAAAATFVAEGGRLDERVDPVSPTQPLDTTAVRPRIIDPVNHASVPAQSATLLQPPPQQTLHAPAHEPAPPVDVNRMSRASFPGESRDSSALQTPMHLMAAAELPAAAGGLPAGDPQLRSHVARLPDVQVMELLNSGVPAYREVAFAVLVERGASAQAALLASFPRPLIGPRRELVASGQALEEHGPVIWLLMQQLRDVVEPLRQFLTHPEADPRYYATILLFRANDQTSLGRVAELLYDADEQVRAAAMRYVETWRQNSAVESVLAVVRRHFGDGDPRNVAISVVASAELRDVTAVPTLIEFLDHASDHVRRRAQTSLVRLTFQEMGSDRRAWEKWYKRASGSGRDRWLLDAMVDRDIRVRENAAREIRSIPRLVVNYNPEFDLRGQQTAQRTVEHFLSLRRGHF
jgi:hypothetical protein